MWWRAESAVIQNDSDLLLQGWEITESRMHRARDQIPVELIDKEHIL